MSTSNIQYLGERGAGAAPAPPSTNLPGSGPSDTEYCRALPTVSGGFINVPLLDGRCLKFILGKSGNDKITVTDRGKLISWITKQGTWKDQVGADGKTYSVSDYVIMYWKAATGGTGGSATGYQVGKAFTVEQFRKQTKPETIRVNDMPVLGDISRGIEGGVNVLNFITNPLMWLAILSLVLGIAIVGFAVIKGIE